jgi:hypothetical protein
MLRWSVSEGLQGGRRPQVSSLPIGFSAALGNAHDRLFLLSSFLNWESQRA